MSQDERDRRRDEDRERDYEKERREIAQAHKGEIVEGSGRLPSRHPDHSYAPWLPEEVRILNINQISGDVHPFTCVNRNDGTHRWTIDLGALIATEAGWICLDCDYTQDWCHDFQLKRLPPSAFDV